MRKILLAVTCLLMMAACKNAADKTMKPVIASAPESKTPKSHGAVEFADQRYVDMCKSSLTKFASGDIDGWVSGFADDVILRWSAGDSLAGKAAIAKYWKDRRMNTVDSIQVSNEIWLPVNVNQPQSGEAKGIWVLNWHQVHATYKNRQTRTFWVHIATHYNNDNMIDEIVQYVDRAPINAAIAMKKK
jgi:hypothetical protein